MKPQIEKILFLSTYLIILLGLLIYLFFNDYGVIRYLKLKSEISVLQTEIEDTEVQINSLQNEIDSLKTNLDKIEEVARERHHMLKPNEEAFQVQEH